MRFVSALVLVPALLALSLPARADIAPGETVVDGILADITPAGLDFIEVQVPYLIPTDMLEVDDVYDSTSFGWCNVDIAVTNIAPDMEILDVDIIPEPGRIVIDTDILVWINSEWDPINLDLDIDGFLCDLASSNCDLWIDPFTVNAQISLELYITDPGNGDPPIADAVVTLTHDLDSALSSDKIHIANCGLGTLNDILALIGIDLVGLVINYAAGDLFAMLDEDLPLMIEEMIEENFGEASYNDTIDILDVPFDVNVGVHDIEFDYAGVRVLVNSSFDAPPADCIAPYDPGGSPETNNPPPDMDGAATHHMAAYLSDDATGAALYSLWRGGVMCYTVDPAEMGFPLDTSFIALMLDEEDRWELERVWLNEGASMVLATLPKRPPEVSPNGPNDINATVEDLGIEFFANTQDRLARIMTIDADVDAGVDLVAPGDGSIAIEVDIDTGDLNPEVVYNEFVPHLSSQVESNFSDIMSGLLDTILGAVVDLDNLAFGPMLFAGMGLSHIETEAAGPAEDWLAVYATADILDPEGVGDLGCGEDGGCDGGCDQGCQDESCQSSCEVDRGRLRPVGAVATGNAVLAALCIGMIAYHRRRR